MIPLLHFPDPFDDSEHARSKPQRFYWQEEPAFAIAKRAFLKNQYEPLWPLLEKNDWSAGSVDAPPGESLTAWRGWWSCVRWDTSHTLIQEFLDRSPLPPPSDELDWFVDERFRSNALMRVFAADAPKAHASIEEKERFEKEAAVRNSVAHVMADRWPGLVQLALSSVKGWNNDVKFEENRSSAFSHPLLRLARPERQQEWERLLAVDGLAPLTGPHGADSMAPPHRVHSRVERWVSPSALLGIGLDRGFEPLVQAALAAGASWQERFEDRSPYGKVSHPSLLHRLAHRSDLGSLDRILSNVSSLETMDATGSTPFLAAARAGNIALLEALAKAGASVHARDRFGQTAAHLAVAGLKAQKVSAETRGYGGQPVPLAKTNSELTESLERVGQTLSVLRRLGVDMGAECSGKPKNSKKSPSPYADLPAARISGADAQAGQTWEQQLMGRMDLPVTSFHAVPSHASPMIRALLLADHFAHVVPPEPEEAPVRRPRF